MDIRRNEKIKNHDQEETVADGTVKIVADATAHYTVQGTVEKGGDIQRDFQTS